MQSSMALFLLLSSNGSKLSCLSRLAVRNFLSGRISLAISNHAPATTMPAADKDAKKVIRSKYKDVMVKAGEDIYYLDRLKLALNSAYFEKLLLSPDWNNRNAEPINIPLDSDTFCAVVDVLYDRTWPAVLTANNYVSVLKAKDFLEIKIGSYGFSDFILDHLENTPLSDVKVFELLKFIVENGTLEESLRKIYAYLAKNLEHFQDHEEFLSLPIDHFVEVIKYNESRGSEGYEEYTYHPYHKDRNLVVEVCCKWICHDFENRLPLIVKVSNSALKGLVYMRKGNDQNIKVNLSDVSEQARFEVVLRYFKRLLNYGTVLDPGDAERPEDVRKKINSFFDSNYPCRNDERESKTNKLKEYVRNGDLYDITVKVQGKAYKLHRSILESKSGYFRELFSTEYAEATAQCDGIPSLPDKDEQYVIEGIDEATFDFIVNYIYFGGSPSDDEYFRVFKAAYILKINQLLNDCKSHIDYRIDKFDSQGRIPEILDFIQGKNEYEDLYIKYLKRHIRNSWPDVGHKEAFYSIPWSRLEGWLLSSDFYFDDAENLLNMCSAWIMHDVKNRYNLVPRMALAIKKYGLPDFEDYKTETPSDLGSVSKKSIRDKLWDILSSLSLIPSGTEAISGELRKFDELPVFVTSTCGGVFDVLNINFDRMATMSFRKVFMESFFGPHYPMSAAIVHDNLFIVCRIGGNTFILAYNIPSKKFVELSTDSRIQADDTLLNRHNELYCGGFKNGSLLKYSFELNRWTRVSKPESNMDGVRFTSDGDKIYRLSQVPGTETDPTPRHNVEWFDFQQNQWIFLSSLPSPLPGACRYEKEPNEIVDFTVINDDANLAVLLKNLVLWYDRNSQKWCYLNLASSLDWSIFRDFSVIAQGENGIVQVFNNQLYRYSYLKKTWELQTEIHIPDKSVYRVAPYHNIVTVNRPKSSH